MILWILRALGGIDEFFSFELCYQTIIEMSNTMCMKIKEETWQIAIANMAKHFSTFKIEILSESI